MIPYSRQRISKEDIKAVVNVLGADFLTQGPLVPLFEDAISSYCTASYAIAVNSATSALHLACLSIGLTKGDWLWTSPLTFVASANCALYCGAKVDFVDIEANSGLMCPVKLAEKLEIAEKKGTLPKIIIPVHYAGQSVDMKPIHDLSKKYNFKIIEDASHALGGMYQDEKIGSCTYSDAVVFSFHAIKIITTGEGGMVVTKDSELAEKIRLLRSHGISRSPELMINPTEEEWYYEQLDLGFNYRLTDIQAALGLSQSKKIDEFVNKRHEIAQFYNDKFTDMPINCPFEKNGNYSSWHLYPITLNLEKKNKSRKEIFCTMRNQYGIGVNVHYIPVHLQPYFRRFNFKPGDFPCAEHFFSTELSLPMYVSLTRKNLNKIVKSLNESLK